MLWLHTGQRQPVPTGHYAITGGSQTRYQDTTGKQLLPNSHQIPQTCKVPLNGEQKPSVRILTHMAIFERS